MHRLDITVQIKSEKRLVAFFHPKDGSERALVFLAPEPETLTTGDKIWTILASSRPLKCSTVREKKLRREDDITLTGAELTPGILNVLGTYLRTLDREALENSQNSAVPSTSFVDPGTSSTTSAATLAIMDTSEGSSVSRKRGHGDDLGGDSVAKKRHMDAASVMEEGSSDAPPGLPSSPGHQEIAGPLEALEGPADAEPKVTEESRQPNSAEIPATTPPEHQVSTDPQEAFNDGPADVEPMVLMTAEESRQPHSAESQAITAPEYHVEPQEEAAEPTNHGATEGSIETDKEAISPLSAPAGTSCDVESPEVSEPLSQSVVTSSVTPAHPTGNQPEQQCSSISGSAESPLNQPSTSRDQALTGGESHTTLKRKTDNQEEPTQPEKRPSPGQDIPEQQTQTVRTQPEIWNWESDEEEEEEEEEVRSTDDPSDNLWVPPRSLRGPGAQAAATRRSSRLADKIAKQLSLHGVRACSVRLQRCVVPAQHDGSTLEQREAPQTSSEGNKKAKGNASKGANTKVADAAKEKKGKKAHKPKTSAKARKCKKADIPPSRSNASKASTSAGTSQGRRAEPSTSQTGANKAPLSTGTSRRSHAEPTPSSPSGRTSRTIRANKSPTPSTSSASRNEPSTTRAGAAGQQTSAQTSSMQTVSQEALETPLPPDGRSATEAQKVQDERRKEQNPQNRQVSKPRIYIDLTKRRRSNMAPKTVKEKNRGAIQSDEEYQSVIDELEANEIRLQETQSTVKERLPLVYEEIRLADARWDFRQLESSKIRLKPLRLAQKVIIPNLKKEIRREKKRIQKYELKLQGLK